MRSFILMFLAVCSVATAAEVYRWVDDNGQVTYSDRPHAGAEKVTLSQAQTFSAPALQKVQRAPTIDADDDKDKTGTYELVKIVNPAQDAVLWSTGGLLQVSVRTKPNLRRGHSLMIFLDGRTVERLTGDKRQVELTAVFRGEHTLRMEIHDAEDGLVANSDSVTFTVKQTSTQNPNNPNVPAPGLRR